MKMIINNMMIEPEFIPSTTPELTEGLEINLACAGNPQVMGTIKKVTKIENFDVVTSSREEFNLWKYADVYELQVTIDYEFFDIHNYGNTYLFYVWR